MGLRRSKITEPPAGSISLNIMGNDDEVDVSEEATSLEEALTEHISSSNETSDESVPSVEETQVSEELPDVVSSQEVNDDVDADEVEDDTEKEPKLLRPLLEEEFEPAEKERLLLNGKEPVPELFRMLLVEMNREKEDPNAEIIESTIKRYVLMPTVPEFSRVESRPKQRELEVILDTILDTHLHLTREERYRIRYMYLNYEFVRNQLTTLITRHEGAACSSDKMRMLIKHYMSQEVTIRKGLNEPMNRPTWTDKDRWRAVQHVSKWVALMDSLPSLGIGNPDMYIEALANLNEAYSKSKAE